MSENLFFSPCEQIVGIEIAIKANTVNVCRIYGTFQDTGKHSRLYFYTCAMEFTGIRLWVTIKHNCKIGVTARNILRNILNLQGAGPQCNTMENIRPACNGRKPEECNSVKLRKLV